MRYSSATASPDTGSYRLIIVNKHAEQVVESSIAYTPEGFIEIYESLLAKRQAGGEDWCLTMPFPFPWRGFRAARLAKKAKEIGLHEIR